MIKVAFAVLAILGSFYAVQQYHSSTEPAMGRTTLVPVVSVDEVLEMIRQGKQVVFIDTREPQEWADEHIPGAINLPLRDVPSLDRVMLGDPDLIVAYCVKDFRGVEVAKALRDAGFGQASVLKEFGLSGWKQRGLPTTLAGRRSDEESSADLLRCAEDPLICDRELL